MSLSPLHRLIPVGTRVIRKGCLGVVATKEPCQMYTETKTNVPPRSVGVVRREWAERFAKEGIFEPKESAEYIIAHALGEKSLAKLNHARLLTKEQMETVKQLCKERLTGKPTQYVIGEWDFHGITVEIKPPVLIPRPETEQLVEFAIRDIEDNEKHLSKCLDIGCGSGVISIALLKAFPEIHVTAVDLSEIACNLAKHNATNNGVINQMDVHCMPLTEDTINHPVFSEQQYELIISNPPYISTQDIPELRTEIKDYEDHRALDGGPDGLNVIRFVLAAADRALSPGGSLWLEVGDKHAKVIPGLVEDLALQSVATHQDFTKTPRFCHLVKSSKEKS